MWLYTCCSKCQLRIICNDNISITTVSGVGNIVIGQDCILQKQDATIFSYNRYTNKMQMKSDIQVPIFKSQINYIVDENLKNIQFNFEANFSTSDTDNVNRKLEIMKEREKLPKHISSHDIHHYATIWCLVGGALATAMYYMIRKRCNKKSRPIAESPRPRRQRTRTEDIELHVIDNATRDKSPQRRLRKSFDFS